jgi:hypothetical protein
MVRMAESPVARGLDPRGERKRLRLASEACRRLARAHVTRLGLTNPLLSSSGPRQRPSGEFGSREAYGFLQQLELRSTLLRDSKFRNFIIFTIMMQDSHDRATSDRFGSALQPRSGVESFDRQEAANLPHRVIDLQVECALPQLRR